jgi:hypothetical protein
MALLPVNNQPDLPDRKAHPAEFWCRIDGHAAILPTCTRILETVSSRTLYRSAKWLFERDAKS